MTSRHEALQEILSIASRHQLTPEEISAALRAEGMKEESTPEQKSSLVAKLFGYIGGILVFAGIVIFIGMQWEEMNSPARIIITLGTGFAAFLMALAALREVRFSRAATPLFLIAAVLQPLGMLVTFDEYSTGGDPLHALLIVSGAMAAQFGATFHKTQRSTLLFVLLIYLTRFFWVAFELIGVEEEWNAVIVGISMLFVVHSISRGRHAVITPFWNLVGSGHLFIGAIAILEGTVAEVLFIGLASFIMYVSVVTRSRTLLVASTIAMLCYIGYFTSENFTDVVGWPITLIIIGLLMIGMGSLAFRLNRKYMGNT